MGRRAHAANAARILITYQKKLGDAATASAALSPQTSSVRPLSLDNVRRWARVKNYGRDDYQPRPGPYAHMHWAVWCQRARLAEAALARAGWTGVLHDPGRISVARKGLRSELSGPIGALSESTYHYRTIGPELNSDHRS